MNEYDEYIGNLVPPEAEVKPTPEHLVGTGVEIYAIGTLFFLVNDAGIVKDAWDENNPEPDEVGIS